LRLLLQLLTQRLFLLIQLLQTLLLLHTNNSRLYRLSSVQPFSLPVIVFALQ
jgi:hypothetical protein